MNDPAPSSQSTHGRAVPGGSTDGTPPDGTGPDGIGPGDPGADEGFVRAWEAWHQEHERRRTDPLGLLAAYGLYWLGEDPLRIPGVPGVWSRHSAAGDPSDDPVHADEVILELDDGEHVTDGARTLTGTAPLGRRIDEGSALLGFTTRDADGTDQQGAVEIGRRGDGVILRPRRAGSTYLAEYPGTPAYPADPRWVVPTRFLPFDEPRPTGVGSVVEGLEHVFDSLGELEFALGGAIHRLIAFSASTSDALTVLLRDGTSGVTTYAACRSLSVPAPDADGATTVDFNRAVNLPCAYTDFATCPLPPPQNHLSVAIQAGEKLPRSRVPQAG